MKRVTIAAIAAATLSIGAVAQACPYHSHHVDSRRVQSYRVDQAPDRVYTGSYDYSPGYYNYGYAPSYGYGWNNGYYNDGYVNSYSTVGIGLGPFSLGF